MSRRPQFLAASVLLLAALATPARAQYVEDSIDVGGNFVGSLAYNSRADVVYGNSEAGNTVFAINCATSHVISTIPCDQPLDIVYDSIDNKAYCTLVEAVLVIDGVTHTALRTFALSGATRAVWDPVADRLYVSCLDYNRVTAIDCRTDSVVGHIGVGVAPISMYINPAGRRLYVLNWDNECVSVINLDTHEVTNTIPMGGVPNCCDFSIATNRFYVGGYGDSVAMIDGTTDSVVGWIRFAAGTTGAICAVDQHGIVVAGRWNPWGPDPDTVCIADMATGGLLFKHATPRGPEAFYYSELTDRIYGACAADSMIVLPGNGTGVLAKFGVGGWPYVFAYSPVDRRLYVGHLNSSKVYVIRDTSDAIAEEPTLQTRIAWMPASPNPFSAGVEFSGGSQSELPAELCVYSRTGERVAALHPVQTDAGRWRCAWDGRDALGRAVPAGVYFVRSLGLVTCSVVKTTSTR